MTTERLANKSIIFSAKSIQAILAGSKTQTRRAINPQPIHDVQWDSELKHLTYLGIPYQRCPWWVHKLWVKERWTPAYGEPRWPSPIFMPMARTRLWLTVVDVRAERLQAITPEDARAEGYPDLPTFIAAWDAMIQRRKYSWDANPWVWVVEFTVAS